MPAVPSSPRVKLRTTSRRVPRARAAAPTVDEPPEPTMRLSRAIMVMLLLHVVAVGGFFASSVLKERDLKHSSNDPTSALEAEDSNVPPANGGAAASSRQPPAKTNVHVVRPGETLTLIANENGVSLESLVAANGAETVTNGLHTGQELKLPDHSPDPASSSGGTDNALSLIDGHAKSGTGPSAGNSNPPSKSMHSSTDPGKTYVVGKGENAYTIAQKNKVSYEALLKLNQIADPKKLQPGQKLRIPLATNKPKSK